MATPPPVSTTRPGVCHCLPNSNLLSKFVILFQNPLASSDDLQTGDHDSRTSSLLHSAERLLTPIQLPLPSGTPGQEQPKGGFLATWNSGNPTFAVLKATALQQAFGHPMAYARVLMQVNRYENRKNLFHIYRCFLDGI
jgi:hypothetical protein